MQKTKSLSSSTKKNKPNKQGSKKKSLKQKSQKSLKQKVNEPRPSGLSSQLIPLFRPQRASYIKGPKDTTCVFCRCAQDKTNSIENLCVYRTPLSMVVLNKFPYNTGHILVLPQSHKADLNELSDQEYWDLMTLVRLSEKILQHIYKPMGLNIGLNLGAAAGGGIPGHLHIHIIPRWSGDLNFFPLVTQSKVIIETLEETHQKLSQAFATI